MNQFAVTCDPSRIMRSGDDGFRVDFFATGAIINPGAYSYFAIYPDTSDGRKQFLADAANHGMPGLIVPSADEIAHAKSLSAKFAAWLDKWCQEDNFLATETFTPRCIGLIDAQGDLDGWISAAETRPILRHSLDYRLTEARRKLESYHIPVPDWLRC